MEEQTKTKKNALFEWYRIKFIGRPYELDRLSNDEAIFYKTNEEVNKVILATQAYFGSFYISAFASFIFANILSKKIISRSTSSNKKLNLIFMTFTPFLINYIYIHVRSSYYFYIRDIIIQLRQREKAYFKMKLDDFDSNIYDLDQIKEIKVLSDFSSEKRKEIKQKTGVIECLKGFYKFNFGLDKKDIESIKNNEIVYMNSKNI